MPIVEFVYEETCPFIQATREQLLKAFKVAEVVPAWSEWEISDPGAPEHLRSYGSPTILVDGRDIMGVFVEETSSCCRIYAIGGEEQGVPPLDRIVSALTAYAGRRKDTGALRSNATILPSVGAALLPKLTCPACWPPYAGLLSSLGVGFVNYTPYLLPLTVLFLAVSVAPMARRPPRRHGYGPFWLGVVAATIVLVGNFGFDSDPAMWAGLGILVSASLWNTWPINNAADQDKSCPACFEASS